MESKSEKKNDIVKLYEILKYFRTLKKYFIISSIGIVLTILISLPIPYLNMILVDKVIIGKELDFMKVVMGLWLGLIFIRPLIDSVKNYNLALLEMKFDLEVKKDIFSKVLHLPSIYFADNALGYIRSRIEDDVAALHTVSAARILDIFSNAVKLIFGLIMMFGVHWKLTLLSIAIIPISIVNNWYFANRVKEINKKVSEAWAVQGGSMFESLLGIETIKLFLLELKRINEYIKRYKESINITSKKISLDILSSFFSSVTSGICPFIIWGYGSWLAINDQLTLGQITAFVGYSGYVFTPVLQLAGLKLNIQTAIAAWERIQGILTLRDEKMLNEGKKNIEVPKGGITFKNVSFSFMGQESRILNNINLNIKPFEKVALVGENGSGKSTLMKLLIKFYDEYDGEILIDGQNIAAYDLYSLRRIISVVSQNVFLFKGTILDNIRMGCEDVNEEEVMGIMRNTHLDELIRSLPNGLNTEIEERGANLSGGQKQLISIARALIRTESKILIFDEATASLDPAIEKCLCENIEEICNGRTFINIVHRPSFMNFVDRVVMLNRGEVVFSGSVEKFAEYRNVS